MELFKDLWAQTLSLPHHQLEICLAKPRKKASLPQFMLVSQFRLVSLCCGLVRIVIVTGTSSVQGKSPGWGGQQMALEASPTLATSTRFHIQQGLKQYFYLQWKDSIMISLMIPLSAWSWSLLNFSRCQKIHLTEEYDICNKNFNINEYLNIFV